MSDPRTRRERGLDVCSTLSGSGESGRSMVAFLEGRGALGGIALHTGAGETWARRGLSRRDRSPVVISALTALNLKHEFEIHLQGALNHGVTRVEIEEVLLTVVLDGGFPRAVDGLILARSLFARADG